jgi:hypothetical protein
MQTITIFVRGGNVIDVIKPNDMEVQIVDYDNLEVEEAKSADLQTLNLNNLEGVNLV